MNIVEAFTKAKQEDRYARLNWRAFRFNTVQTDIISYYYGRNSSKENRFWTFSKDYHYAENLPLTLVEITCPNWEVVEALT